MPRSTKPIEQRIDEKDSEIQKYLDKAKQLQEQKKLLEKQRKEADRKARTKRLIEIGASVESVLGRDFRDGDNIRLMNFLKAQERNGKYFTKAMDKELPKSDESEAATQDILPSTGTKSSWLGYPFNKYEQKEVMLNVYLSLFHKNHRS